METVELIEALGYSGSPHFLSSDRVGEAREHAHIFRRAVRSCSLHGVYLLRDLASSRSRKKRSGFTGGCGIKISFRSSLQRPGHGAIIGTTLGPLARGGGRCLDR